ncbi:hypothetical protein E2562_034372 [Oryza meyeriana var. granulata]|uniref:Uncharacterized protein n=1 Tax=Oryza meyeriana var. granulata TaxID=110450 RepID=A0A6G1ESK7_9ORYZ|nr:hypothetical protein E2562_034372 [Oryza meyeriana var. granulata]
MSGRGAWLGAIPRGSRAGAAHGTSVHEADAARLERSSTKACTSLRNGHGARLLGLVTPSCDSCRQGRSRWLGWPVGPA